MLQQFSMKRNRFLLPESNEIEFNGLNNRLDKVCGVTYPGTGREEWHFYLFFLLSYTLLVLSLSNKLLSIGLATEILKFQNIFK
jgi:hypothetical protein